MDLEGRDEPKMEFVTVGYIPTDGRRFPSGTKLLLDPVWSKNFEQILGEGMPIDPVVFGHSLDLADPSTSIRHLGSWCRAQIKCQAGVTDQDTADALIQFYVDIEHKDWEAVELRLVHDLDFCVPGVFEDYPKAQRRDLFIHQLTKWSSRYERTNLNVIWANISTYHAMVRFNMVCDGKVTVETISEYKFEWIDGTPKIATIYNHGLSTIPLAIMSTSYPPP